MREEWATPPNSASSLGAHLGCLQGTDWHLFLLAKPNFRVQREEIRISWPQDKGGKGRQGPGVAPSCLARTKPALQGISPSHKQGSVHLNSPRALASPKEWWRGLYQLRVNNGIRTVFMTVMIINQYFDPPGKQKNPLPVPRPRSDCGHLTMPDLCKQFCSHPMERHLSVKVLWAQVFEATNPRVRIGTSSASTSRI